MQRATAARRYGVATFYNGQETEYNFSWSQFDAIKSAGPDWREFVDDVLLPNMEKFGGEVATCEAIRQEVKKFLGGTPPDDDVPEWQQHVQRGIDALDAARLCAPEEYKTALADATNAVAEILADANVEGNDDARDA